MKFFIFLYIFFELIFSSISFIPIWDLKSSSIDLTPENSEKEITIYEIRYEDNLHARLTKKITTSLNDQNYMLMKDGETDNEVDWDGIESAYYHSRIGHFVCPTGKNFIHHYKNSLLYTIKPNQFNCDDCNWELICYFQSNANDWMFQGFLNSDSTINLYGKILTEFDNNGEEEKYKWIKIDSVKGLLDFIWIFEIQSNEKYNMYALILEGNYIYLKKHVIQINSSGVYVQNEDPVQILIDSKSTYTHAYYDHSTNFFYWMTSNGTDNFRSGYSTQPIYVTNNYDSISLVINEDTPFFFVNDVTINKLDMIRNTRFVYYEILYNKSENITYRGIIDIELNHIIFNTNEKIKKYKPLTSNSMFVLTDSKAYQVCYVKDNNICIDRCPSGKKLVLSTEGNYCSDSCPYKSARNESICFKRCNITFFEEDNNKCGLCKDINSETPYKIINKTGCYTEQQNFTYIYSEKLKLLDYCPDHCIKCKSKDSCDSCEDGYKKVGNECREIVNCYITCKDCNQAGNANRHNCIKCQENFYFYNVSGEGNCLDNCPDQYYKGDNKNCLKCHESCGKCEKGPENEDEEENQNCDSCDDATKFLIKAEGFKKNCVDKCPNGTIGINDTQGNYCKLEEKEKGQDEKRNNSFILNIYIIIFGVLLVLFSICIYIRVCRNKKTESEFIDEINSGLQNKNKLVED